MNFQNQQWVRDRSVVVTSSRNPEQMTSRKLLICVKVSKIILYFACACALCTYLVKFGKMYSEYPTNVNVDIVLPTDSELPAFTVCIQEPNQLRRQKVCDKNNPKVNQSENICKSSDNSPDFENNQAMAMNNYVLSLNTIEMSEMSHERSQFKKCELKQNKTDICDKSQWFRMGNVVCYCLTHNLTDNLNNSLKGSSTFEFSVYVPFEDCISVPTKAAVYVHDYIDFPNEQLTHFVTKSGVNYKINLIQATILQLEPPYVTMCRNYTKYIEKAKDKERLKKANKKTNIRMNENDTYNPIAAISRSECKVHCLINKWMNDSRKCVPNCIPLKSHRTSCTYMNTTEQIEEVCQTENAAFELECERMCPTACHAKTFDVLTDEEGFPTTTRNFNSSLNTKSNGERATIDVSVNLRPTKNIIYSHTAKFTALEVVGYVGGYVGVFLGLSIPLFYDWVIQSILYLSRMRESRKIPYANMRNTYPPKNN